MKSIKISVVTGLLVLLTQALQAQTVDLLNYNFAANCALPAGWTIQNIDGSCTWRCVASVPGGIYQENHNTAQPSGCSGVADDWLITPPLALNHFRNEALIYNIITQYVGGGVALKYSTNYSGSGSPYLATWTTLLPAISAGPSNINISNIAGDSVYFAFQYTSIGSGNSQASRWMIADILVRGERSVSLINPSHRNITPTSAILGAEVATDGGLAITERGIVWSTADNPTLSTPNTTKVQRQGALGIYDTIVSGLPTGTRIYYRGYARVSGLDFYSPVSSFYTLADEPAQHVTGFTATTLSSNAIVLKWNQLASAKGYLILQKMRSAPSALPQDAIAYTEGAELNDATIASVIQTNTTETDTITGLLAGTRYYYTLIPFGVNAAMNAGTYNYLTTPVIPVANDSTSGVPTSYFSDVVAVAGSENDFISSVENTASINAGTDGAQVLKLALRDGGATLNDADDLPTILTEFTLNQGVYNTANWQTMIQSVGLFDDSTGNKIGTASVSANGIKFTGLNLVAADNNLHTISVRLSLKGSSALPEHTVFQFVVMDTAVKTSSAIFSSQKGNFIVQSAASKNKIRVSASRIRIITQPPAVADAGITIAGSTVELVDVWNNPDVDTTLNISVSSVKNNLAAGTYSMPVITARATFNQVTFSRATGADTLVYEAGTLIPAKSTRIRIRNGSLSDIIATTGFTYARSIPYISYRDSVNLAAATTFPVFGFTVRDGGLQSNDADSASTIITSVKFSVSNFNQLKALALFDSSDNKIAETLVNAADVEFTNLNLETPDNGRNKIQVRATFKKVVNDGAKLQFKITQVSSLNDTLSSQFVAADAGGALSSGASSENRIDVVADQLQLIQQPGLSYAGEVIYPAIRVRAIDALSNTDMEGRVINAETIGGTLNASSALQLALSPGTGYAEFGNLAYEDTVTATRLKFTDGTLTVISDSFDVIQSLWYRSVKSGYWDSLSTWEYSPDKGQTWAGAPAVKPDAMIHGRIRISQGHTVIISGNTTETFRIDETTVDAGATLITPVLPGKTLEVINGREEDLLIYGTLKHTNGTSARGIINQPGSNVTVMPGGMIELAANGYAASWAANPLIVFGNNAVYYHHTAQTNSLEAATYFHSTAANEIPVFRIGSSAAFRSTATEQFTIKGLTEIDAFVTATFSGSGTHTFRNGFSGNGAIIFSENSKNKVSSNAILSGNGIIRVNDQARLSFEPGSTVYVNSNKNIQANSNGVVEIAGYFNSGAYTISGNANTELSAEARFVTAHEQGVKGALATSGMLRIGKDVSLEFNANDYRQDAGLPPSANIAKLLVANPYGLSLGSMLHVNTTLNLSGGSVSTSGSGVLSLAENTNLLNYNSGRFIDGKVRAHVTDQVFLPVGKKQVYAPVQVLNKETDSSVYEIEYFDTLLTAIQVGTLKSVSAEESWNITALHQAKPAKFTLTHHVTPGAGEGLSDLRVASLVNNIFTSVGPQSRNATQTTIETGYVYPSGVFAIAIDQACTVPAAPVAASDTICYGAKAALVASSSSTLRWYASAQDETPLYTGNTFVTAALYTDTAFYVESSQLSCTSNKIKVDVLVVDPLDQPVVANNYIQVCANDSATLTAAGSQLTWFADAGLTMPVASGNSFLTGSVLNDTVFYVASSQHGCLSAAKPVIVATKAIPADPYTRDLTVCKGSEAVLSASANAAEIRWYTSLTQTNPVAVADHLVLGKVLRDTAFYAAASEGRCVSNKVKVQVVAADVPAIPVIENAGVACKGTAITLKATGSDPIRWFLSDADTLPVHTGSTYTTASLNRNTVFFIDASNGTCASAKLSLPVSVLETPYVSGIRTPRSTRQYDSVSVSTDSERADEYNWNFGNDAQPSIAVGPGPHYVKWTTAGNHTIRLSISNKLGMFGCSKELDTVIYVSPSTGISEYTGAINTRAYPNPASSLLTIEAGFTSRQKVKVYLADALGRTVWTDEAECLSGSYAKQVDVSALSAGVYMLSIEAGEIKRTQKVIINK